MPKLDRYSSLCQSWTMRVVGWRQSLHGLMITSRRRDVSHRRHLGARLPSGSDIASGPPTQRNEDTFAEQSP